MNTQAKDPAAKSRRPIGVWLVCIYLLLSEGLAVMALVLSWSPELSQRLIGIDFYAELDIVHIVLILANTILWLTVALDLYHMRRRAARLLGIAFVVGVVDLYWQSTHGWVAHEDHVRHLIEQGGVAAFVIGSALLVGILVYVLRLDYRGALA